MNSELSQMTGSEVLSRVESLRVQERRCVASLVAHLAVVLERRLFAGLGFSSMWDYLTDGLGYGRGAASVRSRVAQAVKDFGGIVERLADGRLHLSGVALLSQHLNVENAEALLTRAEGQSKRAIEEMLSDLAPRPDVRTSVRKVPTKASTESTAPLLEQNQSPRCDTRPARRAQTTPLGEERYKVTFTANKALVAKLERLAALMSHQTASGDLPAVLDKALDIAIEVVEKRRFGRKAQKKAAPRAQTASTRYIPSATRREVHDRDGGRCTFVGTGGRRCRSEHYLQLDHIVPYAKGGTNAPGNLRIRCRSHNLHTAIQDYGQDFMAEFMLTPPG